MTETRRRRRSIVVLAGQGAVSDRGALALAASLAEVGIEAVYIGQGGSPAQIASAAVSEAADAVELCLTGAGGVLIIRELLRELERIGRRDVTLVLHRVS